jgi:DNA-binding transcriptional ArsR family regulator
VPTVGAGPLGELESQSPVPLFGAAFAGAQDLSLFHKAFGAATLSGTLYAGNIVDRERRFSQCDPSAPPREQVRTLATASGGSPDPIYFEVDARALAVVEFGPEDRAMAGVGDAIESDAEQGVPAAYLGPNPVPIQQPSGSGPSAATPGAVRAFPAGTFLVVPTTALEFPFAGVVVVPVGNLTIVQGGRTTQYSSDPTWETETCGPTPLLPNTLSSPVYHTLRIQADSAVVKVKQAGVDRLLSFYARDANPSAGPHDPRCASSDQGYWMRSSESLQKTYEACALPATSYTAASLRAHVDGVARFQAATGTTAGATEERDVSNENLDVAGTLELLPHEVLDGGRRMSLGLDGAIFNIDSQGLNPGPPDWAPYASGAAGGALLFGVALYAWPSLKWRAALIVAPLYARLKKADVLENPLRDDILQLVQETPGISASELGRRVDCGWGTLVYHLTVLERMQLVSSAREGRHKRFFAQGRINYSDKGAVGLLANPAARTILDAIRASPGSIQKDLSERLSLSPGTVAWHVDRLAAEGLVIREDEGRTVRYYPSERLLQLTRSLAA